MSSKLLIDAIMEPKNKKLENQRKKVKQQRDLTDKLIQKYRATGYKYYKNIQNEEFPIPGDILDLNGFIGQVVCPIPYADRKEKRLHRIFRSSDNMTTFCIDSRGRLFGYGSNRYGQLGCGHLSNLDFYGITCDSTIAQLNNIEGWDHIISNDGYTMGRIYDKKANTYIWYHWGTFLDKKHKDVVIVKEPIPMSSEYERPLVFTMNTYGGFGDSFVVSDNIIHVYLGKVDIPDKGGFGSTVYHNIGEIDLYYYVNKNPGGRVTRIRELLVSEENFRKVKISSVDDLKPTVLYRKKPDMEKLLLTHLYIDQYHQLTLEEVCDMRYASNPQIKSKFNQLLQKFD